MRKTCVLSTIMLLMLFTSCNGKSKNNMETDNKNEVPYEVQSGKVIPADKYLVGEDTLYVTLVGHGSVMLEYKEQIIHIDPYSAVADYTTLPKADLILLTHEHRDHLDMEALKQVEKENDRTSFMMSQSCYDILGYGEVLKNGDIASWNGIGIDVVPAYNIKHTLPDGKPYHPKGRGNGYVLKFGKPEFVVYIAGDTENIPEMDALKGKVDIAFLPQNLPYTMDVNMFVDAALKVQPKYLYTYHAKEDEMILSKRIDNNGIEHLIRPMSNKK